MPLKNASWLSVLCLCAALGACCLVGAGDALTIYRLSGADLPAPKEGDFVPLSWEAVDEGRFGATEALEIAPGFIAPEQTDPNLNLAPSTLGGGFSMLSGRWEPPEKMAGWAVERFSVWMIDGDSTTTYQCGGTDHVGNTCRRRGYSYMFAMGKQVFLDRIHFFAPHNTRNLIPRFIIGASNGDQINDVLYVDYELLNLRSGTPTLIQIYDLVGRHIADLPRQLRESGLFRSAWNGRDHAGALVDPGLYILQLKVVADEREDRARRLVSVVY